MPPIKTLLYWFFMLSKAPLKPEIQLAEIHRINSYDYTKNNIIPKSFDIQPPRETNLKRDSL